ncbi:MAG TPA: TetR/AcrR family transcriptional regulator [Polyangiaceae bacterium]|nr:TetR/AcrR family transcriptional regulator [Polyangiaceae bacterium]
MNRATGTVRERPYAGKPPELRRMERRTRLHAAGLHLFGTRGYSGVTIPEICAAAQVTTRHFYDEFDGREALLRTVYDGIVEDTRRSVLLSLASAGDDPKERTRVALDAFLHSYLDDPRRGRVACLEAVGVSAALEEHRRSVIHEFAAVIEHESEKQASSGLIPRRNLRLGSIAMAGATNELVIEWLTMENRPSIADLAEELLLLFLSVLEGARPAFAAIRGPSAVD